MSDRLTLDDLRVARTPWSTPRPVTLADWVEVGESEGGEIMEAQTLSPVDLVFGDATLTVKPGRYLVKRLPDA